MAHLKCGEPINIGCGRNTANDEASMFVHGCMNNG